MAPKLGDRPIVMIEQGGIAEEAFNAVDGRINSMTTTAVFSYYEPNPYREIAGEPQHTNYRFIYSRGGDLRPLNHKVVSARRVFRYVGTDVTLRCGTRFSST